MVGHSRLWAFKRRNRFPLRRTKRSALQRVLSSSEVRTPSAHPRHEKTLLTLQGTTSMTTADHMPPAIESASWPVDTSLPQLTPLPQLSMPSELLEEQGHNAPSSGWAEIAPCPFDEMSLEVRLEARALYFE